MSHYSKDYGDKEKYLIFSEILKVILDMRQRPSYFAGCEFTVDIWDLYIKDVLKNMRLVHQQLVIKIIWENLIKERPSDICKGTMQPYTIGREILTMSVEDIKKMIEQWDNKPSIPAQVALVLGAEKVDGQPMVDYYLELVGKVRHTIYLHHIWNTVKLSKKDMKELEKLIEADIRFREPKVRGKKLLIEDIKQIKTAGYMEMECYYSVLK